MMQQHELYRLRNLTVLVLAALFVVGVLSGCAGLVPQSPSQRIAAADMQVTAAITTVADLRQSGVLNDDQYRAVDPIVHQASAALDTAWAAYGAGDITTLNGQLLTINRLLLQLRAHLPADRSNSP